MVLSASAETSTSPSLWTVEFSINADVPPPILLLVIARAPPTPNEALLDTATLKVAETVSAVTWDWSIAPRVTSPNASTNEPPAIFAVVWPLVVLLATVPVTLMLPDRLLEAATSRAAATVVAWTVVSFKAWISTLPVVETSFEFTIPAETLAPITFVVEATDTEAANEAELLAATEIDADTVSASISVVLLAKRVTFPKLDTCCNCAAS